MDIEKEWEQFKAESFGVEMSESSELMLRQAFTSGVVCHLCNCLQEILQAKDITLEQVQEVLKQHEIDAIAFMSKDILDLEKTH